MSQMRASLFPFLFLAATGLSCPALAVEPAAPLVARSEAQATTHVLGFVTGDHFEQAEALTRAFKQALSTSTNGRLGEGDFSLEVLTAALGCNDVPDTSCLKKISAKTQSRRFVWGTLTIEGGKVTAEARLFEDGRSDKKTQFSYQATMTDATDAELLGIASTALSALLGPLTYKVSVQAKVDEGTVLVDGKSAGPLEDGLLNLTLPSGEHVIRLETKSGALAEQTVRVLVGDTTKVRLEPSSSQADGIAASEPKAKSKPATETEPPLLTETHSGSAQRTWGYITLGTGGVLLAAGGLAAGRLYQLNQDDSYQSYRAALRSSQDACTEADRNFVVTGAMSPADVRNTCSSAKTLELAQIVLFAGGAVAAATGITLLLTSKSDSKTAIQLFEPRLQFGKNSADLGLLMHF